MREQTKRLAAWAFLVAGCLVFWAALILLLTGR